MIYTLWPGVRLPVFLLAILLVVTGSAAARTSPHSGETAITGRVVDADTDEPLLGASLTILNRYGGCTTDTTGAFVLKNLPHGVYRIRLSHVGYESQTIDSLVIPSSQPIHLTVKLHRRLISIKGMTVTPGLYSIASNEPSATESLSREVMTDRPQVSEDLFRAAQRLPGIVNSDFSARFVVRGGEEDEVLINLDGLQLFEPFHLKDIDGGAISITDIAAMEGVDLLAGGYPANFGNRMSGVFNIRSTNPTVDYTRMSLGLSATHARVLGEGRFAKGRGTWLVSARRGYLDLLLQVIGEKDQIRPAYYDLFSKVNYSLSSDHLLTASILTAHDNLKYEGSALDVNNNIGDTLNSSYGNSYAWLTAYSTFGASITGRNMVSIGRVSRHRDGQMFYAPGQVVELAVNDDRRFTLAGLKSDWEYELNADFLIRTGFDVRTMTATYDYLGRDFDYQVFDYGAGPIWQLDNIDSTRASIDPSGSQVSTYLSARCRLLEAFTAEVGVRYDRTSYTGDSDYSPRFNLAVSLAEHSALKFGWGYFCQPERIDEISVQDHELDFGSSARAEHFVIGLQHSDRPSNEMRINAFYKKYSDLRPDFRNSFGELMSFPELEEDRVKVVFNGKVAYGLEFYFKENDGDRIDWWLSYSISKVEDDIRSLYHFEEEVLVNYDRKVPYIYDQKHTMYLDLIYRINPQWQVNMAWQYHTGWPTTEVSARQQVEGGVTTQYLVAGEPWEGKLEPYRRIDLRLTRKISTSKGVLTLYAEVINVFDFDNVRNYEYSLRSIPGGVALDKHGENWFGAMPSFGAVYDFHW